MDIYNAEKLTNRLRSDLYWNLNQNKDIKLGRKEYCKESSAIPFEIWIPPEKLNREYVDYNDWINDIIGDSVIRMYYKCKNISINHDSYIYADIKNYNLYYEDDGYIRITGMLNIYYTPDQLYLDFKNDKITLYEYCRRNHEKNYKDNSKLAILTTHNQL